jgi:hypothetical protein
MYPDQEALVEGSGPVRHQVERRAGSSSWSATRSMPHEMLESGVTAWPTTRRSSATPPATSPSCPTGVWQAPSLEDAEPGFEWTYIPFPGSDDPGTTSTCSASTTRAGRSRPTRPTGPPLAYLAAFSEPDNYQAFVNAVGFLPTQPTATLDTQARRRGRAVPRELPGRLRAVLGAADRRRPVGQRLPGSLVVRSVQRVDRCPVELANQAQADLEAGLNRHPSRGWVRSGGTGAPPPDP